MDCSSELVSIEKINEFERVLEVLRICMKRNLRAALCLSSGGSKPEASPGGCGGKTCELAEAVDAELAAVNNVGGGG